MKVILQQDFKNLGKALDMVSVKDGYARNYLIPRGIVIPATLGNQRALEEAKKYVSKRDEKLAKEARQLAKKIEAVPCTIPVRVKEGEEIFGSVSSQDIFEFLKKEGFGVEKSQILLEDPIKKTGVVTVEIKLHKEVFAKLKVWVVADQKE